MITESSKFVIAGELSFSFGESPNYEYFNRVAIQPQYRRVPRNTLKRHTQQAYYGYRDYLMEMFRTYDDTPTRWNSTYKLLHDAIAYRDVLADMYSESRTDERFITNDHWSLTKIIHDVLETFDNATQIFSYVYEPNIHMVKWCAYFNEFPLIYVTAAILDPGVKLQEYRLKKNVISLDTPTRWNSTYKLLHDAIAYRDVLTDMYSESRTDGRFITNDHWSLTKIIHDVLETFDNATQIFSYVYEPNIHMVILECIRHQATSQANPDPSVKDLLDNMKVSNSK
ncbi:putative AC transposase, partial [Bienertia sinuspersici]